MKIVACCHECTWSGHPTDARLHESLTGHQVGANLSRGRERPEWDEDWHDTDPSYDLQEARRGCFTAQMCGADILSVCVEVESEEHGKWLADRFLEIANKPFEASIRSSEGSDG